MRTQRVIGNRQLNCAVIPQRASDDVTTTQIASTVSVCVCLCWYSYLQPRSYSFCYTFISSNDRTKLSRSRIFRYIYSCILIFANYLHPHLNSLQFENYLKTSKNKKIRNTSLIHIILLILDTMMNI